MIKASVILAFYKRLDYLKLVLAGFERQSFRDFEIIIADDGSPEEIVKEIEKLSFLLSFPITHVWQEDKGFRKNKILNRAITLAQSEYLIFVDADCVPHSKFVEEHFKNRSAKTFYTGRRVNLSEKITSRLTPENVKSGYLEKILTLIIDGILGKSFDVEKGFYFKSKFLRELFNKKKRGLLGCNFSIHKEDIISVNGFDERYEAPSIGEDTDIQFRLELNDVSVRSLNNIAVQYHLYHKLQERPQKNIEIFNKVKESKTFYTPFGIIQ
jgi:glycosyltransferase involved in cell wall biosynthesis